eukprot:scaffold87193_cov27-Tisochrysis_lutea.AAC.1
MSGSGTYEIARNRAQPATPTPIARDAPPGRVGIGRSGGAPEHARQRPPPEARRVQLRTTTSLSRRS